MTKVVAVIGGGLAGLAAAVRLADAGYRPIGEREWPALVRKLDRDNPGYAD